MRRFFIRSGGGVRDAAVRAIDVTDLVHDPRQRNEKLFGCPGPGNERSDSPAQFLTARRMNRRSRRVQRFGVQLGRSEEQRKEGYRRKQRERFDQCANQWPGHRHSFLKNILAVIC